MSDLAPFVEAVLKDRAVHDLHEELKRLKEERFSIQITGFAGKPVYHTS